MKSSSSSFSYPDDTDNHSSEEKMSIDESFCTSKHRSIRSRNWDEELSSFQDMVQFKVDDNDLGRYPIKWDGRLSNNQIIVPPNLLKQNRDLKERTFSAKINFIDQEEDNISIVTDNSHQGSPQMFSYKLSKLKNFTGKVFILRQGLPVSCTLSQKRNSLGVPNLESIFIDNDISVFGRNKRLTTQMDQHWYTGKILISDSDDKRYLEIKAIDELPIENDGIIYFYKQRPTKYYCLPVKKDDIVQFRLSFENPEQPRAVDCVAFEFSIRSLNRLLNDLHDIRLIENISADLSIPSQGLWKCLTSTVFESDHINAYYILRLMDFFLRFHSQTSPSCHTLLCVPILQIFVFSKHFNSDSSFHHFIKNNDLGRLIKLGSREDSIHVDKLLSQFFEVALSLDASFLDRLTPFINQIPKFKRFQIMDNKISQPKLNRAGIDENGDAYWKNPTLIPRPEEMFGRLIENDLNLRKVKITEGYESVCEYMNTYYRLLRADCFSSIQKGISDFISGRLDHHDMNVYQNVSLVGCDTNNNGFSLSLSLTKMFGKTQIKESLIFDSLLCLSPSGMFLDDDPIWATVIQHDKEELIAVQLCSESNNRSDCDNMLTMLKFSDKIIMAESPSYYRSYKPVLQSLQQLNKNNFPLCSEILHHRIVPLVHDDYLPGDSVLDVNVLYPDRTGKIKLKKLLNLLEKEPSTCILDSSQSQAIKYALTHRLAVIQGPPGCGKTVIGRKLVEVILSCDVSTVTPILVMTQNNHCLDEFLMHCLGFVNKDDIVRIGGRSEEKELNECNLNQLKKRSKPAVINLINEIKKKSKEILDKSDFVHRCSQISPESLLFELSEEQIIHIITDVQIEKLTKTSISEIRNHGVDERNLKLFLFRLCNTITKEYKTLKNFFDPRYEHNSDDEDRFRKITVILIENWWPDIENFKSIKENKCKKTSQTKTEKEIDESEFEEIRCWKKSKNRNLIQLKDIPAEISHDVSLLNNGNLWLLDEQTKIMFLRRILEENLNSHMTQLDKLLEELKTLHAEKEELVVLDKLELIENKLIVGITIVGASIHHSLIQKLAPEVVIVEEAAEILEPNLLAALNPSVKHLVMIGDHMQLRPKVETHKLCKTYFFDISMMERLAESKKYPFECLNQQSRMRPEFAELLKDIYPNLKSNKEIVSQNTPPACMQKSMFFWCHSSPEMTESNGYSNNEEIQRILFLTLFLIDSGCEPTDITVLAPYQGQISRLKGEMKQYKECNQVVISTVDKYQGAENKYVIISLVRSNEHNAIGFLHNFNRRCVAQSRAKCGLYFVGNRNTFFNSKYWKPLIMAMDKQGCVGSELGIRCPKHLDKSSKYVSDGKDLKDILCNYQLLCKLPCGEEMAYKVHRCKRTCNSNHSHDEC